MGGISIAIADFPFRADQQLFVDRSPHHFIGWSRTSLLSLIALGRRDSLSCQEVSQYRHEKTYVRLEHRRCPGTRGVPLFAGRLIVLLTFQLGKYSPDNGLLTR